MVECHFFADRCMGCLDHGPRAAIGSIRPPDPAGSFRQNMRSSYDNARPLLRARMRTKEPSYPLHPQQAKFDRARILSRTRSSWKRLPSIGYPTPPHVRARRYVEKTASPTSHSCCRGEPIRWDGDLRGATCPRRSRAARSDCSWNPASLTQPSLRAPMCSRPNKYFDKGILGVLTTTRPTPSSAGRPRVHRRTRVNRPAGAIVIEEPGGETARIEAEIELRAGDVWSHEVVRPTHCSRPSFNIVDVLPENVQASNRTVDIASACASAKGRGSRPASACATFSVKHRIWPHGDAQPARDGRTLRFRPVRLRPLEGDDIDLDISISNNYYRYYALQHRRVSDKWGRRERVPVERRYGARSSDQAGVLRFPSPTPSANPRPAFGSTGSVGSSRSSAFVAGNWASGRNSRSNILGGS